MSFKCRNNEMNSRVKTQFGLVVLGLSVFLMCTSLTRADERGWEQLKTSQVEIEDFSSGQGETISSYPRWLQTFITRVLSWDPRKELNYSTAPKSAVQSGIPQSSVKQAQFNLREVLRSLSVKFDVTDTQHFRKVWFHLTPNLKVRGLFGIHDFKTARPFIILRMGIHGNVDELFAERFIAKAVYEDLDANFLILENLTSHAFLSQNSQISFGGVEEGLHTFLIMSELTSAKAMLKPLIKSLHLIGVSLGGHGTFVTALMDSVNQKKIQSILNMCPLINLKDTFDYHAQAGFKHAAVDLWNHHRLDTLYSTFPKQLENLELWKIFFDFKPRFTPRILQILEAERKTPLLAPEALENQISDLRWPSGFLDLITKSKSFYEMNEFWKIYRDVQTPFMIYTTPADPLVINDLNSEQIFQHRQNGEFKNLKFERLDRGTHCGLAAVFSWDETLRMIKDGLQL